MVLGFGAPSIIVGYQPDELLNDHLINMESNSSYDQNPEDIFNEVSNMMGSNSTEAKENQIKADQKEAAQMKQWNIRCTNGRNKWNNDHYVKKVKQPLSDWMKFVK